MAAGDPTGIALCTGSTNGNTLPETASWENRSISIVNGVNIVSGTTYALLVSCNTDEVEWVTTADNVYTDGSSYLSSDSGSTWTLNTNYDNWFTIYGFSPGDGTIARESYNPGVDTIYNSVSGSTWVAQTFTATSNYTITSVRLRLSRFSGSTPGTLFVGLYNTEPDLPSKATTPAPANAATDVTLDQATLTWVDGGGATSYNVYYGTESGNLTLVSSGQAGLSFTVSGITNGSPFEYLTVRYWRIDSVNSTGTTTGDEWSFTTIRLDPPSVPYWDSTNSQWYILLPQADGSLGDPPPTGVENTDYEVVSFSANFIRTNRRLVALAKNGLYYEAI